MRQQRKEGLRCKKSRTRVGEKGRKAAVDEEVGGNEWVRDAPR